MQKTVECSPASRIKHNRKGAINQKVWGKQGVCGGGGGTQNEGYHKTLLLNIGLSPVSPACSLEGREGCQPCTAHVTRLQPALVLLSTSCFIKATSCPQHGTARSPAPPARAHNSTASLPSSSRTTQPVPAPCWMLNCLL